MSFAAQGKHKLLCLLSRTNAATCILDGANNEMKMHENQSASNREENVACVCQHMEQ
jgi:hypothetical protein